MSTTQIGTIVRTLAMAACIGGTSAIAATFSFTSGTPTKVDSGITMTASAFSLMSGTFQPAEAAFYSGIGTGICNSSEGTGECGFANHHIDNNAGGVDFFLMKFSSGVDPLSVTIQSWTGSDRDVTYWVGYVADINAFNLTGLTEATLPAGLTRFDSDTTTSANPRTVAIDGSTSANVLIFGARIGHTNDYFKIVTVATDPPSGDTPTPEPGTLALIGGALLALGMYRKHAVRHLSN